SLVLSYTPPTPDTSTLSLHDSLPISGRHHGSLGHAARPKRHPHPPYAQPRERAEQPVHLRLPRGVLVPERLDDRAVGRRLGSSADRKSTRLNSSHVAISYAVFCLKKK